MQLLDGRKLSKKIELQITEETKKLKESCGCTPGLAVVLVGQDPASAAYVGMKKKACDRVGFYSITHDMPQDISQEAIEQIIIRMNEDPSIDGILIQLPLPAQIDTTKLLELVDPKKDVDGFHPFNVGRLVTNLDGFVPCTPLGVMELLKEYDIDVKGKNCVVVGASNIVGKPMASLLLNAEATVEICHIHTDDLKRHTLNADMIFVGVGVINLITPDMVKDDVVIVDIGVSRTKEGKLVGDVEFEAVSKKSSYITPSPGGVGPMTIAMLLSNTLKAAKANAQKKKQN
ncbi:MAG: bifunctional methylenetetrahydrofolate dehydrogenase/methenyltetrahydrofolate cyclohydrolase FolD [Sulfurimonas sp.]|nr:bifunctional methylenetetrahydrofolate dehydrogenase/methenyltetrahydrofolate cyclohydrolase FolD [Sulfurimonas sp.]MDQ7068559.1 bifunctional methylenetetrahydrofolate dehydrogenase/methenyltetrahydrofolate cyclohydrolase FolD [Sulfurimonas sp.]